MESLKKFEEVCQPDIRQGSFVILDTSSLSGFRPQTLKDFYDDAESIQLHAGVPENVRDHFETARNLIIYSWFYYPFNVAAELCAYTSVEFALRIKAGDEKSRSSFRKLLAKAVANNWIRDEGFSHVKARHEGWRTHNENLPMQYRTPQSHLEQEYCKAMVDVLPNLRNSLAHGSAFLHHGGAMTVRICAELINQLFEQPKPC